MPTGGSGSPFLRGIKENARPKGAGGGGLWGYSLWSSSHSFSAVGCQQAA